MIASDSILRRLPRQLDRKQLLFFDGMRHAADIVLLAYSRLQTTLTHIALTEDAEEWSHEFSSAYLDAWAIVDAIDRFRSLWRFVHSEYTLSAPEGAPSFQETTEPIRNLRNVADHLAQRADYVVARQGAALGVLSWYTALIPDGREGFICAIVPGTQLKSNHALVNPAGRVGEYPTGLIELSAGEYCACLSEILPHMEMRIRQLESSLEQAVVDLGLAGEQAGTDLLLRLRIKANDISVESGDDL